MKFWKIFFRLVGALGLIFAAPDLTTDAFAEAPEPKDNFIAAFQKRVTATQSKQPGWAVPLYAPHAGLLHAFRQDFLHKSHGDGTRTFEVGGGKGLNLVILPNTQLDVNVPSYQSKTSGTSGFADMSLGLKYRLFTANEKKGNYSSMLGLAVSFPSSNTNNGATEHVLTPNFAIGKGWGRWDVQTSASANFPLENAASVGSNVTWNTLVQAKVGKYFTPEIESNTTFFRGGKNDGKVQSFILPGVMGKYRLRPHVEGSRLALVAGVGAQVAVTPFRTYDAAPVASVRFSF